MGSRENELHRPKGRRNGTISLSIILVICLLAQLLAPLSTSFAGDARPSKPISQPVALTTAAGELETALALLTSAKDAPARGGALALVQRRWTELERAAAFAREATATASAHSDNQLAAVDDRLTRHDVRLNGLRASYSDFSRRAVADGSGVDAAAAELIAALRVALADVTPPTQSLDQLPHRAQRIVAPRLTHVPQSMPSKADLPAPYATPADLDPTEDAPLTPEIFALADELGRDPVAIYQYVRNTIAFEPYYGSRKGALLTLWERSGNDVDTASLLIALMRASGIPARYVRGNAFFRGDQASNWLGSPGNLQAAGNLLASGGVSVATGPDMMRKEHVWVEVLVDTALSGHRVFIPLLQTSSGPRTATTVMTPRLAAQAWVALDPSFKQYTFEAPADLRALTGFDAATYVAQARAASTVDDDLAVMVGVPAVPSPNEPDQPEHDESLADQIVATATASVTDYIAANPNLTNIDLLGGAAIVAHRASTLPSALPFTIDSSVPLSRLSVLPNNLRDTLTIEVLSSSGASLFSHTASFPLLANKRITVSYEAATAADQAQIDAAGGALLTTPPTVMLVPVLRVDGVEVARGSRSQLLGSFQTRRLSFTDANGRRSTVSNSVTVGSTFAVGLAYGRSSAAAIEASRQRLEAARSALPTTPDGNPDPTAPGNMAEPIVGEMLHIALLSYFNQLDSISEIVARGTEVRWFRYLSAGVATQDLVFDYSFGGPAQNRGGGMSFDIQQNIVTGISLRDSASDERAFLQTTGYFGSALEHSVFEDVGRGAVSTIRLLSIARDRDIPVYRIDADNSTSVLPRLQLNSSVEAQISAELSRGRVVTVPEREVSVEDWQGTGYIVLDPTDGSAAYMISGGLAGNIRTISGGSLWDILQEVSAYAWLALNMGLDVAGIIAGIGLLLVPEPTLLTKIGGIALIVANLAALGFDIADLTDLTSGDISAQQYIGEQLTGLLIEAMLRRVGISAAAEIIRRIGPDAVEPVVRQLSQFTGGASDRLVSRGFSTDEIAGLSQQLTTREAWGAFDNLAQVRGADVARQVANNTYFQSKGAIERVARIASEAPFAEGLDTILQRAVSRGDFGYAYELQRAIANTNAGSTVVEYGQRVDVTFERVIGIDASGNPIRGFTDTQPLEGDLVLDGKIFVDAKHGNHGNDVRIWNQVVKAQKAIDEGFINGFRFEVSGSMGQRLRDWAATNAPDVQFVTNLGDGLP